MLFVGGRGRGIEDGVYICMYIARVLEIIMYVCTYQSNPIDIHTYIHNVGRR